MKRQTRLRQARLEAKLSQQTVARLANIPQPTVSLIETGRLIPLPEHLDRLATTLGVPSTELLLLVER